MARHSNNGKSFAWGTVLGGVVGGVAALVLAPKSGDKMRKDLSRKYKSASCKTKDILEDVCEQSQELLEKAKNIACDAKAATSKIVKDSKRRK